MNRIILHIGLHKTATKFYQHHVFPGLDEDRFNYNPLHLTQYVMDYIKADNEDRGEIKRVIDKELKKLSDSDDRTIVISREIMSGDLFSAYRDWDTQMGVINEIIPEAEIIISLRFQPDWLVSCYRESIHEHHYQSIEDFLCIDTERKEFNKPHSDRNENGFAHLHALNLDYPKMLKSLFSYFDQDKVLILFFENLKTDKPSQLARVLSFIDAGEVKIKPVNTIPNRGYSASSIKLSLERYEKFKDTAEESGIHRPIFFFGKNSIPAGNIEISLLDKDKYWGDQFLRDNQEIRSPDYPNLSGEDEERLKLTWRYQVKNVIDVKNYEDWDLLGEYRNLLEAHYRDINSQLLNIITEEEIPELYLKKSIND